MSNPKAGESGRRSGIAMEQTDDGMAGLVGREQDCQPVGAAVALWRMAESAAYANRVLSKDGSYTPDDAVCASATTVAAVCEILGRLAPFLSGGGERRFPMFRMRPWTTRTLIRVCRPTM